MSRWFRLYDELLDDPKVQRLRPEEFLEEFARAMKGLPSAFDNWISGPFNRLPSHEWALIRSAIFERDNYTCTYCGAHGVPLECDHIVPIAKGGTNDEDNLTTACRTCNQSKRDKLLSEWRR